MLCSRHLLMIAPHRTRQQPRWWARPPAVRCPAEGTPLQTGTRAVNPSTSLGERLCPCMMLLRPNYRVLFLTCWLGVIRCREKKSRCNSEGCSSAHVSLHALEACIDKFYRPASRGVSSQLLCPRRIVHLVKPRQAQTPCAVGDGVLASKHFHGRVPAGQDEWRDAIKILLDVPSPYELANVL